MSRCGVVAKKTPKKRLKINPACVLVCFQEENCEEEDGKEGSSEGSGSSSSLNGSSVEVPAVISVDSEK